MAESPPKLSHPRRGEVWLVSFDPTIGSEIKKTRPALVIQNDIANRYSPITIVAAVSSAIGVRRYPTEVLIDAPEGGLSKDGVVLLNQVRSIDRRRLLKRLGVVGARTLRRVNAAIQISFGLVTLA